MRQQKLVEKLLQVNNKKTQTAFLKKNFDLVDLKLAEALKNTYYDSWTKEPQKTRNAAKALEIVSKMIPGAEVEALAGWVKGIANLTDGKIENAIVNLENAAKIFFSLNKSYQGAQTQVGKIYALALLGKYDEAIKCSENAIKIFEKYNDQLGQGKIEKNLGNLLTRQGDEKGAEKYFLAARRRFLKIKNWEELTMADNSLAYIYAEINDFRKAEDYYSQALKGAKKAKMRVTEAEIEASMGTLALFRGKFDKALSFLEFSRQKYDSLKMPHQTAIAELEIADIYLELNLADEAFSIYETVVEKLRKLKLQGEEARARMNFGRVAAVLKQTMRARKELKKSARLYILEKNAVGAAAVKANESKLELDSKNFQKALTLAGEAEELLGHSEKARLKLNVRWLRAEALRNLGEDEAAKKLFSQIYGEAVRQEQSSTAQSTQISLGKIALRQGNSARAEKHFKKAVELVETLRAPLPAEEFRMAFLADKLEPFEQLAKIYLAKERVEEAFLYVEKAKSRSLAETLNGDLRLQNENSSKTSAKLAEKLKKLREELNWFYSRINRAGNADIKNLQPQAKRREKQIADVMRQIESTGDAKFADEKFLNFERLQKQLGKRKALVEFVNFEGKLLAFAVTNEQINFVANVAREDEIVNLLEGLQFQFGSLRYGVKMPGKFVGELKERADFYLQKLYEKLLAPLESFVEDRDLVVVPVGALHYVPFHALRDGESYAVEKRETVYAPSATVWQKLTDRPARPIESALLIGFADEKIPLVNEEIKLLREIFPDSKCFLDKEATFSAFTRNASEFEVLHLACHGQFRPENPLFSSLRLADGWVTVKDVCAQKLKAEIVTLSACETGFNKVFAGDEILGLARGFLSAGAGSLVLSLWTVNDRAALELMKIFYENLRRGESAAASLKISQNEFIRRGAHPYFWSPFAVIGK